MLPRGKSSTERFSYAERFAIGKDAGFEAV